MASDIHTDWQFHFDGLSNGQLLVQRCDGCGKARFPAMPICGNCQSRDWKTFEPAGKGRIYSYVVMRRPKMPEGVSPIVAVVELEDDILVVSSIIGIEPDHVDFDMDVQLEFIETMDGQKTHAFRPI